jgi:hypothetical protein
MPAPHLRSYEIRMHRDPTRDKTCDQFYAFVRKATETRDARMTTVPAERKCEVELLLRTASCGLHGVNRFLRLLRLEFPDVVVVQLIRHRNAHK